MSSQKLLWFNVLFIELLCRSVYMARLHVLNKKVCRLGHGASLLWAHAFSFECSWYKTYTLAFMGIFEGTFTKIRYVPTSIPDYSQGKTTYHYTVLWTVAVGVFKQQHWTTKAVKCWSYGLPVFCRDSNSRVSQNYSIKHHSHFSFGSYKCK